MKQKKILENINKWTDNSFETNFERMLNREKLISHTHTHTKLYAQKIFN